MELTFSQRYGYTFVSNALIRESMPEEVENAICNCFSDFSNDLRSPSLPPFTVYRNMEGYLWRFFLNKRVEEFEIGFNGYQEVLLDFISDKSNEWYRKLDIIEASLDYLYKTYSEVAAVNVLLIRLIDSINEEFSRLNYAYRIIDRQIIEVTSQQEVEAITKALIDSHNSVRIHLSNALELYSQRPIADYRNSIKESISAVESLCRQKTSESTLGKALKKLTARGIAIPNALLNAFDKLYAYTNSPETGIRHALLDDEGSNAPGADEALFMLVSCSAFVNYLNRK